MNAIAGKFKDEKKGNYQKFFFFVVACCEHFQSFRVHNNMNAMNVINKLQRTTKEKEAHKSEHKWRQKEEENLLKRTKVENELKIIECEGVLNIQLLVVRLLPHS